LIREAAQQAEYIVVSIFLNPAQFAPHEDLDAYPKTLDHDLSMIYSVNEELKTQNEESSKVAEVLSSSSAVSSQSPSAEVSRSSSASGNVVGGAGTGTEISPSETAKATTSAQSRLGLVHVIFCPTVKEMYPLGIPLDTSKQVGTFVTITPLSSKLEGVTRPHFFRGVATVVTKLFNIVQPTHAFFGQKDIQQTVVLKRLVADLHVPIDLHVCATLRESDGLAMSSRNVFLGGERRKVAPVLYKALQAAETVYKSGEVRRERILAAAEQVIDDCLHKQQEVKMKLDYLSLAEDSMLDEIDEVKGPGAVLSAALIMLPRNESEGSVRLLDNIVFE